MIVCFMKKLDAWLGKFLVRILPHARLFALEEEYVKILLIRPGGIGDAIHLIPAINLLKAYYPDCTIDVLAESRNQGAFVLCRNIHEVFLYDKPIDLGAVLRRHYDVVVDTEQWHYLSAVVARMIKAPMKIGFGTNNRARMFTHAHAYSHDDYEAESFLRLCEPLGIGRIPVPERYLELPADACASAGRLLSGCIEAPFVAIFPGASIYERRWGAERFRRVAEMLFSAGIKTVVVGGRDDSRQGDEIIAGGAGINLAGKTSLAETAAVIDRSALLISGDSGVLHMAVGLNKPTVSLFGPGRTRKWAPRGERHVVINRQLPCSPCTTFGTTPACKSDVSCMKTISIEQVVTGAMTLLTQEGILEPRCCRFF